MANAIVENLFLVNAPAGSGKTTWIRKSVGKYLLQNPNDNVLLVNYMMHILQWKSIVLERNIMLLMF